MPTLRSCKIIAVCVLSCLPICVGQSNEGDTRQLVQIEEELRKADLENNAAVAEKYLAPDYLVKSVEGKVYDKAATIESIHAHAKHLSPVKESVEDCKSSVLGSFALVTCKVSAQSEGQAMSFQSGDLFRKDSDGWKLVSRTGTYPSGAK